MNLNLEVQIKLHDLPWRFHRPLKWPGTLQGFRTTWQRSEPSTEPFHVVWNISIIGPKYCHCGPERHQSVQNTPKMVQNTANSPDCCEYTVPKNACNGSMGRQSGSKYCHSGKRCFRQSHARFWTNLAVLYLVLISAKFESAQAVFMLKSKNAERMPR